MKKMLPWLIMILVAITLIMAAAYILWNYMDNSDSKSGSVEPAKLSAEEIKALTVDMNDVITNLSTKDIVKVSFTFELDSEGAKKEFELLDFKVKDMIIQTIADMTPEQIQGSKGKDELKSMLLNKINGILDKGKCTQVNLTNFVLT